jgi:hypothetical protein
LVHYIYVNPKVIASALAYSYLLDVFHSVFSCTENTRDIVYVPVIIHAANYINFFHTNRPPAIATYQTASNKAQPIMIKVATIDNSLLCGIRLV